MGAWGTAIFSDDTASDVRDDFKDYIGDGLSAKEATNRILEEWQDSINDPDDGPVFWLALAATQWRLGRLNNAMKESSVRRLSICAMAWPIFFVLNRDVFSLPVGFCGVALRKPPIFR